MQLAGKVAFITGMSEGIGRATALLFVREGAKVAGLSRTQAKLDEVVAEIEKGGGEALGIAGDVASGPHVKNAIDRAVDRFGRLDIVFANAGINGAFAPLEHLTIEEWSETLATNLTGTFLTVKYAAPHLKKQGGSVIINSSVNGVYQFSMTGATAYGASKAGQVAFARMAALELAPFKIRVNTIHPGGVETTMGAKTRRHHLDGVRWPVSYPKGARPLTGGAAAEPGQVAQLVLFLASDASNHITGAEVLIDGGESLLIG